MQPYDPSKLKLTVLNVYSAMDNAANTKVCWSYNFQGGTGAYSAGQNYALPTGIVEAGASVIITEVNYAYDPLLVSVSPPKFLAPSATTFVLIRYASVPLAFDANGVAQ